MFSNYGCICCIIIDYTRLLNMLCLIIIVLQLFCEKYLIISIQRLHKQDMDIEDNVKINNTDRRLAPAIKHTKEPSRPTQNNTNNQMVSYDKNNALLAKLTNENEQMKTIENSLAALKLHEKALEEDDDQFIGSSLAVDKQIADSNQSLFLLQQKLIKNMAEEGNLYQKMQKLKPIKKKKFLSCYLI